MDIDTTLLEAEDRMSTSVDYFQRELRGMRTGRATTALLEYVKVEYYGSSTDLRELAAINVADATTLLVKPFDPSSKTEIVKAIESAGIGVRAMAEGPVVIRNERRDANKAIDAMLADKKAGVTEDQAEAAKESMDELTKKYTKKIDEFLEKKITEIEEV